MKQTYKNCQSCGMPLKKDEKGGGTNADGSKSEMYCGKNADDRPYSSLQTDPHSVRSNHIPTSPMLLVLNSVLCIIDLHLMTGSISVRRRGVGLSDYSR